MTVRISSSPSRIKPETGDLVTQRTHTYLVARVSSATIDALASFEAAGEDRESVDPCDGPGQDEEPAHDNEPSVL